jgi:hypothetical protein
LFARPLAAEENLLGRFRMDQAQAHGWMRLSQRGAVRLILQMTARFLHSVATEGLSAALGKVSDVLARKRREWTGRRP